MGFSTFSSLKMPVKKSSHGFYTVRHSGNKNLPTHPDLWFLPIFSRRWTLELRSHRGIHFLLWVYSCSGYPNKQTIKKRQTNQKQSTSKVKDQTKTGYATVSTFTTSSLTSSFSWSLSISAPGFEASSTLNPPLRRYVCSDSYRKSQTPVPRESKTRPCRPSSALRARTKQPQSS